MSEQAASKRSAKAEYVYTDVTRHLHSLALTQEGGLSRAVTGQSASYEQRAAFRDLPVDAHRFHHLMLMPEDAIGEPLHQTGRWAHGAERAAGVCDRRVVRVHIGGHTCLPTDRSRAADMVGMMMSED